MTNVFYSVILNEKESKKTENITMTKQIEIDLNEEWNEEDKKAYLEYLKKNNKNSVTDNNEIEIDLDEEWSEEDKKAYLKYLKEKELKISTDKE